MSFLAKIGARIAGKAVYDVARRYARDTKMKRKAYKEGYSDAKKGKPSKY